MSPKEKKDPIPVVLLVLTLVTGIVDAVSVLTLGHVFTANMTGNVVFLAFAAAGAPGFSIPRSLTSLVAFMVGAVLGGGLIVRLTGSALRRWFQIAIVSEAALLFAAAVVSLGAKGESTAPLIPYVVISLTAIAMGLRNASVRHLAVPDMTTTVLTLTLTGLAADSSLAGGHNPRIARRGLSVLMMFAGAAGGTVLTRYGSTVPLLVAGFCVLLSAVLFSRGSTFTSDEMLQPAHRKEN